MAYIENEKLLSKDKLENPCNYCSKTELCTSTCFAWREGFKLRWAKITAYGEKAIPIYLKSLEEERGETE